MQRIVEFKVDFDTDIDTYIQKKYKKVKNYNVILKSLDARKAPLGMKPKFFYRVELNPSKSETLNTNISNKKFKYKPIIIGAGPAGLFSALRFAEAGVECILLERGQRSMERMKKISKYWRHGQMDKNTNVCFGEGGAGLFSDGKLLTRVKSPLVKYVLQKLVEFGAPEHILYESNPHLGSNKIRTLISSVSDFLKKKGVDIRFEAEVKEIGIENNEVQGILLNNGDYLKTEHIVLATGHSANEIYEDLKKKNVFMKLKDFAVGVRVEHPRKYINKIQFGKYSEREELGAARYRVSWFDKENDRGTYSFCMCPGGYVLSSGTENDGIVINGMSNFKHNSPWSNSAIVVSVKKDRDFSSDDSFDGLKYLQEIEKKAFECSKKFSNGISLPAMTMEEFMSGKLNDEELPKSSSPSKVFKCDLSLILPDSIIQQLKVSIKKIDRSMKGFNYSKALVIAPETRTSAPLIIERKKEELESINTKGLYPCGEGAGYAGGITSAAIDGVKVSDAILDS